MVPSCLARLGISDENELDDSGQREPFSTPSWDEESSTITNDVQWKDKNGNKIKASCRSSTISEKMGDYWYMAALGSESKPDIPADNVSVQNSSYRSTLVLQYFFYSLDLIWFYKIAGIYVQYTETHYIYIHISFSISDVGEVNQSIDLLMRILLLRFVLINRIRLQR